MTARTITIDPEKAQKEFDENCRRGWKLIDKNNQEIKPGDIVTDFRGEKLQVVKEWPPHKVGSSGKVDFKFENGHTQVLYAHVANLRYVAK